MSGSPPDTGAVVAETEGRRATERALLFVVALLLANPVVLFLLTDSILASLGAAVAAVVLVQASYGPRRPRLLTAYVVNGLALASLFAHAEVVFDARFSDYAPENLYSVEDGYYFNHPHLVEHFRDKEFAVDYLTNRQGLRIGYGQDPDDAVERADWLFIGDSFTQGAQVSFEELYTTLLYHHFPDRVVVNAGISGLGLPQEYRLYLDRGRALRPQHVFLQLSAFNDFMNVRESEAGLSDHLVVRSDFVRFLLQDIKYENPPALPLGRWTEPFRPTEEENREFNVFYVPSSERKEQDLREFARYLRLFRDAVVADGADLTVVFIPTKEQVLPRHLEEVTASFGLDPATLDMSRPNRLLRSLCDSLRIPLVDLTDPFRSAARPVFFEYDEHLTPFGHFVMAEAVASRVGLPGAGGGGPILLSQELTADRYPVEYGATGLMTFQSWRDGNSELFLTDPSVGVQRLTFNDVDEAHPMLSPDHGRIVFTQGDAERHETDVVVMNVDGSGRRTLTPGARDFGAIPTFSPDGRAVAYAGWRLADGRPTPPRVIVLDLGSGRRRAITPAGEETWRPVFSPDGTRLAYIKRVGGQFDVFVRDLAEGREQRVTETDHDEWDPQFSPDGGRLVYAAHAEGNWDLFAVELADGRQWRLTRTIGDEWDPAFAPDGRSILYAGEYGFLKGIYRLPLPG